MSKSAEDATAAERLVDLLVRNGVEHAFCVPGESYLAVLDALRDSPIALTVCRHESGAAMMAEAVGKATGRPGVCFVTRGPGATNASAGLHVARHDSTPMILFVGQVDRVFRGREAFQEMDYEKFFGGLAKHVVEVGDAARLEESVSHALRISLAGRPGPVVVSLCRDMLTDWAPAIRSGPALSIETAPSDESLARLSDELARARRPIVILGGARWSAGAVADIKTFAERFEIPVATSYRRLWLFDPLHACYAGDLGLAPDPRLTARVRTADLVLLLGGRLGDIPSQGFKLLDIPRPRMRFVHAHPAAEELGRIYEPDLGIHASPIPLARALANLPAPASIAWREETAQAHADYLDWSDVATPQPGGVNLGEIMVWLRDHLPADAILCNGAGNYAAWIHRFYRFRSFATHIAPTVASMGYGLPAAVAMQRLFALRCVVCLAGDGDFLMTGQEFATAAQYDLPIVVIICDNGSYGTIRMHQEREYPGRVCGTDLKNPDFADYARAFGGFGVTVERTQDFPEAFRAAQESRRPAIVHLRIATDAISPGRTLTAIRQNALDAATKFV